MLISDMFYRSDDTTNSIKALKEGIGSFTMGHLGHAPTLWTAKNLAYGQFREIVPIEND